MDGFKAHARSIHEGLEPELSVVVDVMYPMPALTRAVALLPGRYPHTPLRLYVEALGGVIQPVLDRNVQDRHHRLVARRARRLASESLLNMRFVTVVAPTHPLARSAPNHLEERRSRNTSNWSSPTEPPSRRAAPSACSRLDLAPGRSGSQTRIPASRLRLGPYALAHGAGGPGRGNIGKNSG